MLRPLRLVLLILLVGITACGSATGDAVDSSEDSGPAPAATFAFTPATPSPTPSPAPSPTRTATLSPTRTPSPPPTRAPAPSPTLPPTRAPVRTAAPAPAPAPATGSAFIIGDGVQVRSAPSTTTGEVVARLGNMQPVELLGTVKGERWVVGDQTWPMADQSWTATWYEVEGGYVYSAFVFIPGQREGNPLARTGPRRIDVDLSSQTLTAYEGDQVVFVADVTTGKDGFETPKGSYTVGSWGRVANETMTSSQAAINDPNEQYNVKNVLFTQYFDGAGDALHLNYWQPAGVFGAARTSHGCVGLLLHDAQWLWLFASGGVPLVVH